MSNAVTNAKLPTGDNQNQSAGQTARNGSNQTAPVTVSAGQSREIFSQVNVNLGTNLHNSDLLRRQEKSPSNNGSEGEKADWKSIKQGTDSAKTSKTQETDSPKTLKTSHGNDAKPNKSDNRESKEQTHNSNNAVKSNNNHRAAKSGDGNNSAAKNSNQTTTENDANRSSKSNNQLPARTSGNERNDENRNLSSRSDNGNPVKPNNETNRAESGSNRRGASQSQSDKKQISLNVSTTGLNRGQGQGKVEQDNWNSAKTSQSAPNQVKTLPNNQNAASASKDAVENTPLFNDRNQPKVNNIPGRNSAPRHLNLTISLSAPNNSENTLSSRDNRQNKFLSEVITQVFRESDVYLSKNAVKNLVEQRGGNVLNRSDSPAFERLPKEIFQLVETIENEVLQTSNRQQIANKNVSNRVSITLPPELDNQIQAAKNLFTQIFGISDAKHFSQLNIRERMLAAIEIFLRNLPAEMPGNLQNKSAENVLAGFLLVRGLISSDSQNRTENLLEMMQSVASDKISLATMRDFGGLVKVLISDAATSKSTANLEVAVQKFVRILAAINCLDTILTAVKLAGQSQFANGNVGRTLAIVQVYELINRLVLAGQNAMQEAAEVAQKKAAFKGEPESHSRSVFAAKTVADLNETDTPDKKIGDSKNARAESALRNFLEFNPMLAADKFISAFENSDDARQAQNDFLNHHQIEIEQWLRGGNHRLVKDVDFEKPIGIVVERHKNDFFSATTARIVLVRDGSVQGWHFLKSFLVA